MKKIFIIIPVILIMAGCTCTPDKQCKSDEDSPMITTKVGETFTITLDANPTTGYKWQLSDNLTESIVKLVKSEYVAPETDMVGAGGKEVWTFKGVKPGETTINLEYVRPWETGVEPVEKENYRVVVE